MADTNKRYCDNVFSTILCESKIHVRPPHDKNINCKVCIVCQPELSFPIYNDPEFNFPKTIKEA